MTNHELGQGVRVCVCLYALWVFVYHLFFGGTQAHDLLHNRPLSLSHILETNQIIKELELHPVCHMLLKL